MKGFTSAADTRAELVPSRLSGGHSNQLNQSTAFLSQKIVHKNTQCKGFDLQLFFPCKRNILPTELIGQIGTGGIRILNPMSAKQSFSHYTYDPKTVIYVINSYRINNRSSEIRTHTFFLPREAACQLAAYSVKCP